MDVNETPDELLVNEEIDGRVFSPGDSVLAGKVGRAALKGFGGGDEVGNPADDIQYTGIKQHPRTGKAS